MDERHPIDSTRRAFSSGLWEFLRSWHYGFLTKRNTRTCLAIVNPSLLVGWDMSGCESTEAQYLWTRFVETISMRSRYRDSFVAQRIPPGIKTRPCSPLFPYGTPP
eukprot:scaffold2318_cov363-Pavlova_lutheri.AAC.17